MHYGMDYEILCTVDSTFVLSAFIPFPLCQTSEETPLLQVRCTEQCPLNLLNMQVISDPLEFEEDA